MKAALAGRSHRAPEVRRQKQFRETERPSRFGRCVRREGATRQSSTSPRQLPDLFAASAAARGDILRAATILGATEAAREVMGAEPDEDEQAIRTRAVEPLSRDVHVVETAWAEGLALDLGSALELAAV